LNGLAAVERQGGLMPKERVTKVYVDKDKFLPELKNSIQSPVAMERLIHRVEQGEFNVEIEIEEA
jgi:hypothetical protein